MTTEELNALIAKAESGDVAAMNQLGHIYGQDEYKDLSKAFYWINKSAETGDMLGMSNLGGWCYMYGNGVEKNIPLAIEWLEKAANMNNVWSMNRLTTLYGTFDGYINSEQAAKWFLELIKRECDPYSGVYEKTGYNKDLYEKVKNAVLNSTTEEEMMSSMSGGNSGSLFSGAISFTTSNAKSYINQAEAVIRHNIEYKEELRRKAEEEAARKRAEEESARREAEEQARHERIRLIIQERLDRQREEEEKRKKEEQKRLQKLRDERAQRKLVLEKIEKKGEWSIGEYAQKSAFSDNELTAKFSILNTLKAIGPYAFRGCHKLKSVTIPNTIIEIGESAFQDCINLSTVSIGYRVEIIGENAFKGCVKLEELKVPKCIKRIGQGAFDNCAITEIENSTFSHNEHLTSISLPNTLTKIGMSAFKSCNHLSLITIPDGVVSIGSHAFEDCSRLISVYLPASLKKVGTDVFWGCEKLTKIIVPKGTKERFEELLKGQVGDFYKKIDFSKRIVEK